ncbi:MAG: translation initiation factor IF-2 [Flavobacteriales bacterium]|nr:translation initiation factor IF-2 [Flavobacteriales bacterium]|tara:strand:- start:359 stop:3124 length:2766 start_codon:yes stop_codon:yes gene_type:complete
MSVKRLSKVARELNVGISTIVEFLDSKGVEIEAKPNTKIDPEVYSLLSQEFQSDQSAKEESKHVSMPNTERESVSIESPPEPKSNSDDDDNLLIKNVPAGAEAAESTEEKVEEEKVEEKSEDKEDVSSEASAKEEPAKEEVEEAKEGKPRVVGKIDLDSMNLKSRPDKKSKAAKEEEAAKAAKKEEPKAKEEEKKKEEPKKEEPKAAEKAKEPEKKGREEHKTDVEKLEGVKVLGKIELPVEKKPKPVASSSEDKETQRPKRKRKRIASDKPQRGRGGRQKKADDPELTDKQIQEQIKETLARLTSGGGKSKGAKYRKQKREAASEQAQKELEEAEAQKSILKVTEFVTANELAAMMDVNVNEVISACMTLGLFVSINQRLDAETLTIVAEEFGYEIEFIKADSQNEVIEEEDDPDTLEDRYPIVTVMGHVDHGKTSLLDYIREANVIAGEAGGITQHIGAYNVEGKDGKRITFLDTPGHEAFTAMRARGAQVTDVVIVVIAADDSVMPQTKEAINHAQAAGVPIVFALNKVDRPNANPDKIKEELSQMDILVEDWGGKYQSQEVSAKTGDGVDELLEKVLLEAELLDLKANPNKNAVGTVIESELDKGRGYVTTLLVQSGTIKIGDVILAGPHSGRIKAMYNERGNEVKEAGPSIPVSVLGLSGAPSAGDRFNVMDDEREARNIATKRLQLQREQGARTKKHITLDEIGRRIAIGDFQELNVIVKGDVDGSIEALSDSLLKLSTEQIQVNIIHKSVGQITESDIMLAAASDAIVIGFQVRPSVSARKIAENEEIDIRLYSIIYDAIEELKSAMEGMLKPKVEEEVTASIEIRETFKISKVGTIAGCMVLEGKVNRNDKVRVIRDGVVVFTGELGSLKRFKDDVKEVAKGYECGLNIENYNDIKVGDIVESYKEVEVKQKL